MRYDLIVQRLGEYRKKCHILQNDMAEYLDITQSQYSKLELGRVKLSYEVLKKLYRHGCDIDKMIIGKKAENVLSSLQKSYMENDERHVMNWLKMCQWAIDCWREEEGKEEQIGSKLLRRFTDNGTEMTALERLRRAYGVSQQEMSEITGVNIKKYRQLEKGNIQLDAELMANIYEATKCRPSYFVDENNFYLSIISEECRYGEDREERLENLLSAKKSFEKMD